MRLALLAAQPNPGSWSTMPHVPWSPSHNYGESERMWWTRGWRRVAECSMNMNPALGQEREAAPLPPMPLPRGCSRLSWG